jgi:alpha-D-xyloside xylohydrolase
MESNERCCWLASAILLSTVLLPGTLLTAQTTVTITQETDGVTIKTAADTLRLTVCGPQVVHVVASPEGKSQHATPQQPWVVEPYTLGKFTFTMPTERPIVTMETPPPNPVAATLDTGGIKILISLDSGNLQFNDEHDQRILKESHDSPRRYEQVMANGESLYRVSDRFPLPAEEGIYGLGQHQNGVFNYRGTVIELAQINTDIAIPLFVSTKGYGLFWNTAAKSYIDNRFPSELRLSAEAAHAIDYYFIYGPEIDQIIHQYRTMTGHAPLFGEWVYGFFQSKDRYKSAAELLSIANEYRSQHVPLDVIVQDWFWWIHRGDPEFRPDAYPDLPGTLRILHNEHLHAMISVWSQFDAASRNYKEMLARGLTIPGTTNYDATNPAAGDFYWNNLVGKKFAEGWDAFWLDASEPETGNSQGNNGDPALADKQLYLGNGALYVNIFPLMHTGTVYRHWRESTNEKRVFLLTRSSFAGEQRNAAAVWSGDVYSTFQAFIRQVPAGLNFALSGMPYWTTDIAGYGWQSTGRDTHDPSYQELYVRWFEFGTFCPIFRTHGHRANDENELFSYGPVTPIVVSYDKLRYRLLPYIYSLAWNVTSADGTIMRPLVMDWRTDEKVWNIGDQFMFGPSILVNPVTQEGATSRWLYLPPAGTWYDFWTGSKTQGNQRVEVNAPLDRIPLYVKAGSILPLGPEIEYAGEKRDASIELRVYRGADGAFDLYEDAGDTYAYEKGMHSLIPIRWNDAAGKLTIGARTGDFVGMAEKRSFHVVFVRENHGAGAAESSEFDQEAMYSGQAVSVTTP